MYTAIVTIPRITPETVKTLNASVPGLLSMGDVPLIETEWEATEQARKVAIKRLSSGSEYISGINSVTLNDAGTAWMVNLRISGD